jgi:hypothetical protein
MDASSIQNNDKKLSSTYASDAANVFIESYTKKVPNLFFMGLAGVSVLGSVFFALRSREKTDLANFVGHWAPTFLMLGIYNKLVKVEEELLSLQEIDRRIH